VLSGKNTKEEDKIARKMVRLFAITVSLLATIHSIPSLSVMATKVGEFS
jgi:hypothetical protein